MKRAFTLIEILVAVAIFSLIVGAASGVFISALRAQRKSLASQEILDQTSYLMEYMSRSLRMARKELATTPPACLVKDATVLTGYNYATTTSGTGGIKFKNYQGLCQEFFREWDPLNKVYRLKEVKAGSENYLTSPDLNVVSFNIGPSDSWDQGDNLQPRVTFFLDIKGAGQKPETQPEIKIQTTISQRKLDVQY